MDSQFDLIETLNIIRLTYKPEDLYKMWNEICTLYDHKKISTHEYDELKDTLFEKLNKLANLANEINQR